MCRQLLLPVALAVAACGGSAITSQPVPSAAATPAASQTQGRSSERPIATSGASGFAARSIVEPRGNGVTLAPGENGPFELRGGRYRVAWLAKGCVLLELSLAPTSGSGSIEVPIPSGPPPAEGEHYLERVPAGRYYLNSASSCDTAPTFRLEAAE